MLDNINKYITKEPRRGYRLRLEVGRFWGGVFDLVKPKVNKWVFADSLLLTQH